jgi:hypothetical protein
VKRAELERFTKLHERRHELYDEQVQLRRNRIMVEQKVRASSSAPSGSSGARNGSLVRRRVPARLGGAHRCRRSGVDKDST